VLKMVENLWAVEARPRTPLGDATAALGLRPFDLGRPMKNPGCTLAVILEILFKISLDVLV